MTSLSERMKSVTLSEGALKAELGEGYEQAAALSRESIRTLPRGGRLQSMIEHAVSTNINGKHAIITHETGAALEEFKAKVHALYNHVVIRGLLFCVGKTFGVNIPDRPVVMNQDEEAACTNPLTA